MEEENESTLSRVRMRSDTEGGRGGGERESCKMFMERKDDDGGDIRECK